MIRKDDFRISYLEEAQKSLMAANKILRKYPKSWDSCPEFWANMLGAIANSNIAQVSDDVVWGLFARQEDRQKETQLVREMLDKKLGPSKK